MHAIAPGDDRSITVSLSLNRSVARHALTAVLWAESAREEKPSKVENEDSVCAKPPLLVLGTQRCGSTLLTRILSAHPAVFVQNELPLQSLFTSKSGVESAELIVNRMLTMIARRQDVSTSGFLANNAVWGLKDPQLTEYLDDLERFPQETRFIVLIRDPRAVVNSYIDNKWGLGTNAFTGAERWVREVQAQLAFAQSRPGQCLVLRYEDLLSEFPDCVARLCEFLGVPPSDEMIRFFEQDSRIAINRQNINTMRDVDPAIAEKWRKSLTPAQVALIESVAHEQMVALGYALSGPVVAPGSLTKSWLRLHQKVVGELQLQYQLKRAALRRYRRNRSSGIQS